MSDLEPKQVIVVRKDLGMRMGKVAAQVAHASMAVLTDRLDWHECEDYEDLEGNRLEADEGTIFVVKDSALDVWLTNRFTKIVVYVNSEEELLDIFKKAQEKKLMCSLIKDAGLTEFKGVPTYTCCAIGPEFPNKLDPLTRHLPLL